MEKTRELITNSLNLTLFLNCELLKCMQLTGSKWHFHYEHGIYYFIGLVNPVNKHLLVYKIIQL